MAINHYECLILLDVAKVSGNQEGARSSILATLQKHGCEVIAARPWDERKLAYPIQGQKKGHYFLTFFKVESTKIDEIQGDFRINELILRFMTQKIPAKWTDEMMAVAKDDNRLAFQAMHEEAPEGGDVIEDNYDEGDSRPQRRGGRRQMEEAGKD